MVWARPTVALVLRDFDGSCKSSQDLDRDTAKSIKSCDG